MNFNDGNTNANNKTNSTPAVRAGIGPARLWIRAIFRDAFEAAGPPYFNPRSLRNTLVRLGETHCRTPEDFKAWSQNLGHEEVLTTFYSYGQVGMRWQGEIIHGLAVARRPERGDVDELAQAVVRELRKSGTFE